MASSAVRKPAQLAARQPEFEALWASVGPGMIETAARLTGKAFPPGPHTARLTLCNLPSQSIVGLIVNMRYALKNTPIATNIMPIVARPTARPTTGPRSK